MPSLGYIKSNANQYSSNQGRTDDPRTVTRYGKSTLPDPQPTANVPLSHPLSGHEFIPLQAQSYYHVSMLVR